MSAPSLFDHVDEVLKDGFTSALCQDVLNNFAATEKICVPEVGEQNVLKLGSNVQLREKIFPVLRLHGVVAQVHEDFVELFVVL